MNIEFVGRHFEVDETVREFALGKLEKVLKFLEEPIDASLILEREKHSHRAEIHLKHRHGTLMATDERESNILDAVGSAIEKAEKQARRSKKKFVDKRRRSSRDEENHFSWPVDVVEASSVGDERPQIIKSSRFNVRFMSLEEAALELEASKNEFVVYRDVDSSAVHVLYRRKDANYGLIAPGS